ncbi:MAG TPA: spherulation-specific family 4 protein [Actinocrinis sp.]|nr:spherulation-specific family 4 protein [Actinocrinis sp.]
MTRHLIARDRPPAAPMQPVRSFPPLPRFAVPAYFNPLWDPVGWQALAALGPALSFAILNPGSGPGLAVDRAYIEPIAAVQASGGSVIGYVDTGYGKRPTASILRDVMRYQSWYGLRGAFLDQVSSGRDHLAQYRRIVETARHAGMDFLVLNPGVTPDPGYAELADVVVTFEGSWLAYRDHSAADWTASHPPERFCHLVHSTPPEELAAAQDTARAHHVGAFYVTELGGANPWGSLSRQLEQQAAAQRASATHSPPR